jgi:hypothetical protein
MNLNDITPMGGGQYEAKSRSDHLPHHVDVHANGGKGFCSCQDWHFRRRKHLNEPWNENLWRQPWQCVHLHAALQKHIIRTIKS